MQKDPIFSPKYWVIHDKRLADVYLQTASKSRQGAVDNFCNKGLLGLEYFGVTRYKTIEELFHEDDNLEAILVEVKQVPLVAE
jgi:hypothetical protein|tara:strand:+ start:440 stop:688 length:249 start_codon:yes stop_codon:yes gene_type:complete